MEQQGDVIAIDKVTLRDGTITEIRVVDENHLLEVLIVVDNPRHGIVGCNSNMSLSII